MNTSPTNLHDPLETDEPHPLENLDATRLIIIRGLPGSGKSTLAREICKALGFVHFENDMYFESENGYVYDNELQKNASGWCISKVSEALLCGLKVVVSNTFLKPDFVQVYRNMTPEHIVIECCASYGSTHDIPQERIDQMATEWEHAPGAFVMGA